MASNGDRLFQWREEAGLTQEKAAERLGVKQGTYAAWELDRAPDLHNALQIEKLTDGAVPAENWPKPKTMRRRIRRPAAAKGT